MSKNQKKLSSDNRWVKLAQIIPCDGLASVYSKELNSTSGRESIDVRMVIVALIAKHKLGLDDTLNPQVFFYFYSSSLCLLALKRVLPKFVFTKRSEKNF